MRYCGESTLSKATSADTAAAAASRADSPPALRRRANTIQIATTTVISRTVERSAARPAPRPLSACAPCVETVASGRMPRCCAAMSTAAPRLSTCSGRSSWSANIERRPSGASTANGMKHTAATATNAATTASAPRRPRCRQRWAIAIGRRIAGHSLAAKPSPSRIPLTTGRCRTIAASAPNASSVGQRS